MALAACGRAQRPDAAAVRPRRQRPLGRRRAAPRQPAPPGPAPRSSPCIPRAACPAPLAGLGMGGIWNADVVPGSRHTFLAWLSLVARARPGRGRRPHLARAHPRRVGPPAHPVGPRLPRSRWAPGCFPGLLDALAEHVPGGGLLRDGTRVFALCLPVYAGLPAAGAEWLAGPRAGLDEAGRRFVVGAVVALPALLLYDAAWGVSGALRAVDYPASWATARAEADLSGGDLLVLPFSAYRAPAWNHRHTVLDPLGRYLPPNYLADDGLVVDGRTVPGEDPRVPEARRGTRAAHARGPDPGAAGPGHPQRRHRDRHGRPRPPRSRSTLTPSARGPGLVIVRLRGTPHDRTVSAGRPRGDDGRVGGVRGVVPGRDGRCSPSEEGARWRHRWRARAL